MTRMSNMMKSAGLLFTGAVVWGGLGGGCLPQDFWVGKSGEITNGLIIAVVNVLLAPTGIAI